MTYDPNQPAYRAPKPKPIVHAKPLGPRITSNPFTCQCEDCRRARSLGRPFTGQQQAVAHFRRSQAAYEAAERAKVDAAILHWRRSSRRWLELGWHS